MKKLPLFPTLIIIGLFAGIIILTMPNELKKELFSCHVCSSWHLVKNK